MEPVVLTNDLLTKFGIVSVLASILIWLLITLLKRFFKDDSDKSQILTKEREELKATVNELRVELNSLNEYIRNEHKLTIEKNTIAYNNMCSSHEKLCTVIEDLTENMKRRRATDKDK
jgi:cell division protein FtsB